MRTQAPIGYEEILAKVYKFLSFRPRSEWEIMTFLTGKHANHDIRDKIIDFLKNKNLINDHDFANWWISQRTRFRPKGKRVLQMELKQKGISETLIQSTLSELGIDAQLASAKSFIEKRLPRYQGLTDREISQKLGRLLAGRGFDWETIKRSIDDILKDRV